MSRLIFVFVFFMCLPSFALDLRGSFVQGGFVIGTTTPGSSVYLNNQPIDVAADGTFIFGIPYDRTATMSVRAVDTSQSTQKKSFTISPRKFDIQKITGLPLKMVTPSAKDVPRIKEEARQVKAAKDKITPDTFFAKPFLRPAEGKFSGFYGSQRILNGQKKNPHLGLDIAAPKGADVRAPQDGVVTLVGNNMYYNGNLVVINHGLGLSSLFLHLDEALVKEGDVVKQGDLIGKVGSTGRSTGPHLHWGVAWLDTYIDPELLLHSEYYMDTATKPELIQKREDGYISNPKDKRVRDPVTAPLD